MLVHLNSREFHDHRRQWQFVLLTMTGKDAHDASTPQMTTEELVKSGGTLFFKRDSQQLVIVDIDATKLMEIEEFWNRKKTPVYPERS